MSWASSAISHRERYTHPPGTSYRGYTFCIVLPPILPFALPAVLGEVCVVPHERVKWRRSKPAVNQLSRKARSGSAYIFTKRNATAARVLNEYPTRHAVFSCTKSIPFWDNFCWFNLRGLNWRFHQEYIVESATLRPVHSSKRAAERSR